IDNARLYADATRRAERLRELAEVERVVGESLDLDDVLARITDATERLLGAPVAHVWTTDPATDVLRRRGAASAASSVDVTVPDTLPLSTGIVRRVVETSGPV